VLAVVAAAGVGLLLPAVSNPSLAGGLASRLAVAGRPAVLATLAVTVLTMVSGFTVLTYVRPLLEGLTGFDREALPESPAERRSGPNAPKVFPCPQP
jgi:predicted MFS family arabinose efflux permease